MKNARIKYLKQFLLLSLFLPLFSACEQAYAPKPQAYFRIDFPEKSYQKFACAQCPFQFEYPTYGNLYQEARNLNEPCWYNIGFKGYKGTLYITYRPVDAKTGIDGFIEDDWKMIYQRLSQRAEAIESIEYSDTANRVYGLLYDIQGNAASSVQFYLTDSLEHFVRGSLYFSCRPNYDSLQPVIHYFRQDVEHLIETFRWHTTIK